MAKVFTLLQKLSPSRRLKLLQDSFSQTHRLALEAWVLAYRDMHKGPLLSLEAKAANLKQGQNRKPSEQEAQFPAASMDAINDVQKPLAALAITDHSTVNLAAEVQPTKAALRGIASFYRKGTTIYQVSVCMQSLCITARKVKDLDRAVDILLILLSIKQKVGSILIALLPCKN